jgi:aromatic-L-amino-acid/L-tryptophan decarboxylase
MTIPSADAPRDLTPQEFRRYGRAVVDWIAEHQAELERLPVLSTVHPGEIAASLPLDAPEEPEELSEILWDCEHALLPGVTHWNHPGFMAYFAITPSGPGILGEMLAAALNVNAMLWKTSPAATELEERTLDWLRQMMGLPEGFKGVIQDTASTSTLVALAGAREAVGLGITEEGMSGRELPPLRIYCSREAHSSVEKAALTLGLGRTGTRRIPTDERFRMDVAALAAAVEEDLAAGWRPVAVVATVGTTSTTSVDPVPEIADVCERHGLWLHVDAAYGGAAAVAPEMRHVLRGCERADSLVVNPHKWLFVPIDCSALYLRRPEVVRRAFSPRTEAILYSSEGEEVTNLMDYGPALGRRFRSLKLWMTLRYFGRKGLAEHIREHCALARGFAGWIDGEPGWERLAPTEFSVVVFRFAPPGLSEAQVDAANAGILAAVNASGDVFLSQTQVNGRYALRLAIGNLRTRREHVRRAWDLLRGAAAVQKSESVDTPGV